MMNVSVDCEDQGGSDSPSCYQEFALCFSFLKKFGSHLSLPEVSLLSLEVFFSKEAVDPDDPITFLHHQLVSFITRRPVIADNWTILATRMVYTAGVIRDTLDYEDYTSQQRLVLLKFLCEAQFDKNQSFKHHLSKIADDDVFWREEPIGLDKEGKRYWILQDADYDIRVYSEFKYLEYPFDHPQWKLLCRSLDQLLSLVDSLSGSIHVDKEVKEGAVEEQEEADRYPEGEETGDQK